MTHEGWAENLFIYGLNERYLSYSSYDEDGTISPLEFKETALVAYEQAIRLAPREAILHFHRGQLLEQLGRAIEASQSYEEARRLGHNGMLEKWAIQPIQPANKQNRALTLIHPKQRHP